MCSRKLKSMIPQQPGEERHEFYLTESFPKTRPWPFREGKKAALDLARDRSGGIEGLNFLLLGSQWVPPIRVAAEPAIRIHNLRVWPVFFAVVDTRVVDDDTTLSR